MKITQFLYLKVPYREYLDMPRHSQIIRIQFSSSLFHLSHVNFISVKPWCTKGQSEHKADSWATSSRFVCTLGHVLRHVNLTSCCDIRYSAVKTQTDMLYSGSLIYTPWLCFEIITIIFFLPYFKVYQA